jgi:squalene-hopene/tetraprenyl-beta-curcumene cyclase
LLAAAEPADPAIAKAVTYLVQQQNADGSWSENEFTGTGFPCVFYLKYHLYRNSFPLYSLARFRNQLQGAQEYCAMKFLPAEFRLRGGF